MMGRHRYYLVQNGYRFLQGIYSLTDFETDPEKMEPKYTVYKFDAARIRRRSDVEQVARVLMERTAERLRIVRFDAITGEVTPL